MTTKDKDIMDHPKYISPITDFGFKRIFKDPEITRGFLNALMKTQYPDTYIASVTITDGELDGTMQESDCNDDLDKWIYNLTNMPEMKTQLAFANDIPLFARLEQIASYSALTPKQQMQYDDSFNNYLAVLGNEAYNKRVGYEQGMKEGMEKGIVKGMEKGIVKGMEQGMAKGRAEEKLAIARSLKAMGIPTDQIAQATDLTPEEINEL